MGLDLVILHPDSYPPEDWQRVLADLPRYLPAIEKINRVDDALVLHIAPPVCQTNPNQVQATLTPTELDGLPNAAQVTYHNTGPAALEVTEIRHQCCWAPYLYHRGAVAPEDRITHGRTVQDIQCTAIFVCVVVANGAVLYFHITGVRLDRLTPITCDKTIR